MGPDPPWKITHVPIGFLSKGSPYGPLGNTLMAKIKNVVRTA